MARRRRIAGPKDANRCWTPGCTVRHPDWDSRLCGYCRAESGLPGVRDYKTPSDAMPPPAGKPVYRMTAVVSA